MFLITFYILLNFCNTLVKKKKIGQSIGIGGNVSWGEPQVLLGTVSQTPEQKEAIGQKATSVQEKGCLEECLILPRLQKPGVGGHGN